MKSCAEGQTVGLGDLSDLHVPQVKVGGVPAMSAAKTVSGIKYPRSPQSNWISGKFLSGRIPLAWLTRACCIGSQKTLAVALAIWFLVGLRKRKDHLKLTTATLAHFDVTDRSAKYRALKALETAGLIKVDCQRGKNPLVSIVDVQ